MKLQPLALVVAVLPVIFSCTREAGMEQPSQTRADLVEITLRATGESPADSKATLEFPFVKWQDSDQIAIFDGTAKNVFSIPEGGNHGTSATFSGTVTEGAAELYAVSPAAAGTALAGSLLTVNIPSVQSIPSGLTAAPEALVCVAKAQQGALQFRNVVSLIKISISAENVTSAIISGTNLSGTARVNSDGTLAQPLKTSGTIELKLLSRRLARQYATRRLLHSAHPLRRTILHPHFHPHPDLHAQRLQVCRRHKLCGSMEQYHLHKGTALYLER